MIDRDTFESWPKKKQKDYVKRMYPIVSKQVIQTFRREGLAKDKTGKIRDVVHHCWEKGMGGAIPLWYYIDKRNMLPWSDSMHKTYHDVDRDKWTVAHIWEAEIAECIKKDMIEDNKAYNNHDTSGLPEFNSVKDVLKTL